MLHTGLWRQVFCVFLLDYPMPCSLSTWPIFTSCEFTNHNCINKAYSKGRSIGYCGTPVVKGFKSQEQPIALTLCLPTKHISNLFAKWLCINLFWLNSLVDFFIGLIRQPGWLTFQICRVSPEMSTIPLSPQVLHYPLSSWCSLVFFLLQMPESTISYVIALVALIFHH